MTAANHPCADGGLGGGYARGFHDAVQRQNAILTTPACGVDDWQDNGALFTGLGVSCDADGDAPPPPRRSAPRHSPKITGGKYHHGKNARSARRKMMEKVRKNGG